MHVVDVEEWGRVTFVYEWNQTPFIPWVMRSHLCGRWVVGYTIPIPGRKARETHDPKALQRRALC
jgi:hypothetical protein